MAAEELSGAWAWTTNTRTYLRVRPSKAVPVVAKVPSRSKMFVWGKYNGWYRVETPDHTFGWVYHQELNCPKSDKIAQLSRQKAIAASERSGRHTLYDSPELLKTFYARYGAPGAVRGLAKQGISLAQLARPSTARPATKIAASKPPTLKAGAHKAATRKAAAKIASRDVSPRSSAPDRVRSIGTAESALSRDARLVASAPLGFEIRSHTRDIWQKTSPSGAPDTRFMARPTNRSYVRGYRHGESNEMPIPQLPVVQTPFAPTESNPRIVAAPTPNAPESATRLMAVAATPKSSRSLPTPRAAKPVVRSSAPATRQLVKSSSATKTIKAKAPVAKAPVAKVAVAKVSIAKASAAKITVTKAPVRKVTVVKAPIAKKAPNRWQLRAQLRAKRREQRLATSRARLRSRLGLASGPLTRIVPPLASGNLRPISPEDLMRAREAFLASRHKTRPNSFMLPQGALPKVVPNAPTPKATPGEFAPSDFGNQGVSGYPGGGQDTFTQPGVVPSSYGFADSYDAPQSTLSALFSTAGWDSERDTVAVTRVSQEDVEPDYPIITPTAKTATVGAVVKTKSNAPQAVQAKTAKPKVSKASRSVLSSRGSSARRAAAGGKRSAKRVVVLNRGGSPRDYMNRAATGSLFGETMARQAMSYRGMPYIRGASSPNRGFDCSGLIYFLLRQRGYSPPRSSGDYGSYGKPVGRGQLQSGDIVLFANTYRRGISHVGLYIGNNNFVHAARSGEGVRVDSLASRYYAGKFHSARRVK